MAMLRLASSKVVSNAVRAISSARIFSGSCASLQFSSVTREQKRADKDLAKSLKSKIKSSKRLMTGMKVPEAPAGSLFEIQDIPGESTIKLTRETKTEKIVIEVNKAWNPENKNVVSDDSDDSDDDVSIDGNESHCLFTVIITPKEGTTLKKYSCRANADSIALKSLEFKESPAYIEGPSILRFFGDEGDKDLEEHWRKVVLGQRGIDASLGKFMLDYMIKKYKRDHLIFLEKFRKFVKASN